MNIELLDSIGQFEGLKKGDKLLVRWSDYYIKHTKGVKSVMLYTIDSIINDEIICQRKYNH